MPLADRTRTSLRLRWLDLRDRIGRRGERLVPPRTLGLGGHADFTAVGDELLGHLVTLVGLQPGERILDVGCGAGRLARPLTGYLSAAGSYDGFDVDRRAIGWCRRRYRGHPNFRFRVADVHHRRFNPAGEHPAAQYRFPYDDGSFDVAVLFEVLTHLLEQEADHYLAETARVLRPGGRALLSLFVLDDESRPAIADGRAALPFLDPEGHVAVVSDDLPEEAVAYDLRWLRERLAAHGLELSEPVRRGTWVGADDGPSLQDLAAVRRAP